MKKIVFWILAFILCAGFVYAVCDMDHQRWCFSDSSCAGTPVGITDCDGCLGGSGKSWCEGSVCISDAEQCPATTTTTTTTTTSSTTTTTADPNQLCYQSCVAFQTQPPECFPYDEGSCKYGCGSGEADIGIDGCEEGKKCCCAVTNCDIECKKEGDLGGYGCVPSCSLGETIYFTNWCACKGAGLRCCCTPTTTTSTSGPTTPEFSGYTGIVIALIVVLAIAFLLIKKKK